MTTSATINQRIATELGVAVKQVEATVGLIKEGATIPFIARYRKEVTGGLDDAQLRRLDERLAYLTELEDRRGTILKSIADQGKLDGDLERKIRLADTKVDLEDLYAPYKPKRRTKAMIAREAGLAPLADALLANPSLDPETEAAAYASPEKGIADAKAALDGARHILIEAISEKAELVGGLREWLWNGGKVGSKVAKGKEAEGAKFSDYFDFSGNIADMPSHRVLALLRGRAEGILDIDLDAVVEAGKPHPADGKIMAAMGIADRGRPSDKWLADTARLAWKAKLAPSLQTDLFARAKERADAEAISVFSKNLKDLLLAAPAGPRVVMGLDPGIRTGVKVAVVDRTAKVVDTATIYPHEPRRDWQGSLAVLAALCLKHKVELIAIGNGTASRETDKLAADLMKGAPQLNLTKIMVSEAGASVYSASALASDELPDLDVSLRGAVSIARRLQDPLAELVKIDPKSIGVGQYQHDVDQSGLARSLEGVVEDCVNSVGVDVNTASPALLTHIAGLNATLASNIVAYRNENGPFKRRRDLAKVPRLGPKAFEQSAGFLRIMDGADPLDASAVHPEAYEVVARIADKTKRPVKAMIGDLAFLKSVDPREFADERFGLPTITDILVELEKPGRDPRPEFRTASFADGVETIGDLKIGMQLEGVVTNVTNFGAFVDVGVHQDGLVHISELADRFVKDPREVVKAGDVVRVRVKEVDAPRKRIALTMRSGPIEAGKPGGNPAQAGTGSQTGRAGGGQPQRGGKPYAPPAEPQGESALAAALRKARGG